MRARTLLALVLVAAGCGGEPPAPAPSPARSPEPRPSATPVPDAFARYLDVDGPIADGFRSPLADAARVETAAAGRVLRVEGTARVEIRHVVYENAGRREIDSIYAGLDTVAVRPGDAVPRGAALGTSRALRFELREGSASVPVRPFLATHRTTPVPPREPVLVLVDPAGQRMRILEEGRLAGEYEVGFGQGEGRKRQQGDLRTPRGMYHVIARSRGPFPGRWGAFYGGHWIQVNYPNAFDAAWGRAQGLIDEPTERAIARAWVRRGATAQRTPLGGGIGLHGWISDWDLAGSRRLSWGCVVMRNADIAAVWGRIPVGAMVVILE